MIESTEGELSKVHIITVVWDEEATQPKVDLGDIPPQLAIAVLQQTINALFECLPEPMIIYNNEAIYSTFMEEDE